MEIVDYSSILREETEIEDQKCFGKYLDAGGYSICQPTVKPETCSEENWELYFPGEFCPGEQCPFREGLCPGTI